MVEAFTDLYKLDAEDANPFNQVEATTDLQQGDEWVSGYVDQAAGQIPEIKSGVAELMVSRGHPYHRMKRCL